MNVLSGKDAQSADVQSCGNYHKSAVKELKCNHVRLCGIMIQINNCEIMCLNVCPKNNLNSSGGRRKSKEVEHL